MTRHTGNPQLVVGNYPVDEVILGEKTALDGKTLYVDPAELETIAAAETALAGVEAAVAHPGDAVRIIHVLDACEAMVKVEGPSTVYPGFLGPAITAGQGITNKLTGMLVVSTTEFPEGVPGGLAFREGIIDMTGPGQPYCQASQTVNLVLRYIPRPGVSNLQLDDAVRRATLRIAERLGQTTQNLPRHVAGREYSLKPVSAELPKVVYIDQILDQAFMTHTFVYGWPLGDSLPTVVHPNELIDGAIVSGNYKNSQKVATYLHCNKPPMMELFRRHGVDLNFVGMVINRGHRDNHTLKERGAQYAAKLAKLLGAEGAVVAFEGGGNATIDFMLTVQACEQQGISAVAEMFEESSVGSGEFPIVYHVPEANALISRGAVGETVHAPKVARLLGGSPRLELYGGEIIVDAAEPFSVSTSDYWGVWTQLGESGFVARDF